jgi:leader peptidase (prepilin peptidase)/N-methyltransferase
MHALMTGYFTTLAAIFGLLIGSFLNVVIYRVPAGETLMGRSHCPKCGHMIRGFDNVPVLSWLILRGKCRDCKAPISLRYPTIEFLHAASWVALVATMIDTPSAPLLPLYLFFASVSIALAMIDFDTMRLPNVIVYPTFIITLVYLTVLAVMSGDYGTLLRAVLGGAVLFGGYFAMWYLTGGRGLGFGDVKLAAVLGMLLAWHGWGSIAVGTFSAFVVGGLPIGLLMVLGILKRGRQIPFGPMLLVGTWVGLFFGESLWASYMGMFA